MGDLRPHHPPAPLFQFFQPLLQQLPLGFLLRKFERLPKVARGHIAVIQLRLELAQHRVKQMIRLQHRAVAAAAADVAVVVVVAATARLLTRVRRCSPSRRAHN